MSSDDSEGNQSPGHHEPPMSPPSATKSGRRASSVHSNSSSPSSSSNRNAGGYIGTSSRQPIHTPLISSQPVNWEHNLSLQFIFIWIFYLWNLTERINWLASSDRRGKANATSRGLSDSNQVATDEGRRKVPEEDSAENKEQGRICNLLNIVIETYTCTYPRLFLL